jgi:hypothetical protein
MAPARARKECPNGMGSTLPIARQDAAIAHAE